MSVENDSRFVTSLKKAFVLLDAVRRSDRGLTLAGIRKATGFDLSTAQRHAFTLVHLGYLVKIDSDGPSYRLATRFLDYSFAALRQDPIVRIAAAHLDEAHISDTFSAWFSLVDGDALLYVLRHGGESYMKSLFAGRRAPLYSTAGGRAVLSHLSESDARAILATSERALITPYTLTDIEDLMAAVSQARRAGFSTAIQETKIGEAVAACAVLNSKGKPIGAIHVSAGIEKVGKKMLKDTLAPVAIGIANQISRDIRQYGY